MNSEEYIKCWSWDTSKARKELIESLDNQFVGKKSHEMNLRRVNKLTLNATDDKRKFLNFNEGELLRSVLDMLTPQAKLSSMRASFTICIASLSG